jgi:hypothetical protein
MPDENSFKINLHCMAALLGWYLMVPPSIAETSWGCAGGITDWFLGAWIGDAHHRDKCSGLREIADSDAPLSKWLRLGPFETVAECDVERRETLARGRENGSRSISPSMQPECIASDDPRLKEK